MRRVLALVVSLVTILFCSGVGNAQQESATAATQGHAAPPPATVTGSGTANYIPMWTGSSTLGNSKMYQTGGKIGIATTTPTVQLDVNGRINVAKTYRISGFDVLAEPGGNLAVGESTLPNIAIGSGENTAVGNGALKSATTSGNNTAVGDNALGSLTTGGINTAIGQAAMYFSTLALHDTALGQSALYSNTRGNENTALGTQSLLNNTLGNSNIAIGYDAAINVSGFNSNNIHIGSLGLSADTGVTRIGTSGSQTSFFAAGVSGVTTGLNDAVPVVVDTNGQLGTISSSRRFKEDIQDMGEASRGLLQLRPVTFRYQKPFADGSKPMQYGLVAEEVEQVYPDLVVHSADGQVETVKYQVLDSMLLNEVQRQQAEIHSQETEIGTLQKRLAKMEAMIASISHGQVAQLVAADAK